MRGFTMLLLVYSHVLYWGYCNKYAMKYNFMWSYTHLLPPPPER